MRNKPKVEDDEAFEGKRYRIKRWPGIAVWVDGWELENKIVHWSPDDDSDDVYEDVEEVRTGQLLVVMVGDDTRHRVDPDDLIEIDSLDYCASCGQIGCTHDGRDRSEDDNDSDESDSTEPDTASPIQTG